MHGVKTEESHEKLIIYEPQEKFNCHVKVVKTVAVSMCMESR